MAIGDAYVTAEVYRQRIRKNSSAADLEIDRDLLAVSRYINRITGYTSTGFNADASDVTRYQLVPAGNRGMDTLWIDSPLSAAPTSVTVDTDADGDFTDETALDLTQPTGDVLFLPFNRGEGPEARPISGFRLTSWNSSEVQFWPPGHIVRIIGKAGWPAIPKQIEAATIELTAIWRLESPRATEQVTEIDQVTRVSNEAQRIVRGLTSTFKRASMLV